MSTRDLLFPAAWGAWVGVLGLIALIWSGGGISPALLGGAAVVVVAGVFLWAVVGRTPVERTLVATSPAPLLLAAGVTVALNGVAFGLWLYLVGAEIFAAGVYLLVREERARR